MGSPTCVPLTITGSKVFITKTKTMFNKVYKTIIKTTPSSPCPCLWPSHQFHESFSSRFQVFLSHVCDLPDFSFVCRTLRCENRPANSPASRETGLEKPCCPASDLLWVQITQSYPNRLRFSSLPCPQSPCHTVIDPVFKEGFFPR